MRKGSRQAYTEVIEAVGYVRVSTAEQADSGLSLESQMASLRAQATANGWKLIGIHEDAGVSAKNLDRPGLKAALADLHGGRVLLAVKMDRLTRSVRDLYDLVEQIERRGAEWACVQEKFDTTTATGRLMLNMIVQLSQWEREVIGERTSDALAAKRRRGERLGTTPLGFRTVIVDGVATVETDAEEMVTVEMARGLRADGLSMQKIAAELTRRGRKTKRGGSWRSATVANILNDRYLDCLHTS